MMNARNILLSLTFLLVQNLPAQEGWLDQTFGQGGKVTTDLGGNERAKDILIQPDGKILVTGYTRAGSVYDLAIARHNADGSPDVSFGIDGKIVIPMNSDYDYTSKLGIQNNGKILVTAGYWDSVSIGVINRLNPDGSPDLSFGTAGSVKLTGVKISDLTTQADDKILVSGNADVWRFMPDGSPDPGFGTSGVTPLDLAWTGRLQIQPDGKIVVGGMVEGGLRGTYGINRLHANGTLDLDFGTSGMVSAAAPGEYGTLMDINIQQNGGILVALSFDSPPYSYFYVLRYHHNGLYDMDFGDSGTLKAQAHGSNGNHCADIAIQADDKILLAGYSSGSDGSYFSLLRCNAEGKIDSTFGENGWLLSSVSTTNICSNVEIQQDGKIVLGGTTGSGYFTSSPSDFALVRYTLDVTGSRQAVVFPNPVTNQLYVQTKTPFINAVMRIVNVHGEVALYQENINGDTFVTGVSTLEPGIYILHLADGTNTVSQKIIKY